MADVDITGNRGAGFLQRSYAGIPMWGWIVGGVALVFGLSKMGVFGGNKATAQSTPARSGAPGTGVPGQPPNIFFLPQGTNPIYAPPAPTNIRVIVNRNPGDGPDEEHPGNPPVVTPPEPVIPPPMPLPTPMPPVQPPQDDQTWTVDPGNTLWDIAGQVYGDPNQWGRIYDANAGTIEHWAQDRGMGGSDHGHWIFPGEVLKVPGAPSWYHDLGPAQ